MNDRSDERQVPAPHLRETADIWFDTASDPVIVWDEPGHLYELVDPGDLTQRLTLFAAPGGSATPALVARALAEGLAACDFPPTGDGASATHVDKALRAAGIDPNAP